jgi:hypothetical protein
LAEVKNILIFLASPGDVTKERAAVEAVVNELNRSIGATQRIALRVVSWEHNSYPGYGADAQAIINSQIAQMGEYALFVGIMWNRIGTVTPRALSGTVEEFNRAAEAHRKRGRPDIWFYFRDSAARLTTEEQLDQKKQVLAFRREVEQGGLSRSYASPTAFKELFREHLTLWLAHSTVAEGRDTTTSATSASESQRIDSGPARDIAVAQLLAGLTANCTKARALQIEDELYDLLKSDVDLYLRSSDQYVAPAREAVAVVGGRILHAGTRDERIVSLLRTYCTDPDMWVRKKAHAALILAGY